MRPRNLAVLPVIGLVAGMLGTTAGQAHAGATSATTATPATATASTQAATGTSAAAGATVQTVALVTGDRVALSTSPDGKPEVNVVPAAPGRVFKVLTVGSQVYVLPQQVAGAVGAPLDASLFNVSQLAAEGYANSAKPLKLAVSYAKGATAHALPGVTSAGTVTKAGAVRFGAAVQAAMKAGKASHLFAGISRIAVAGAKPAKSAAIHFGSAAAKATANAAGSAGQPGRLYTITIRGIDRLGRPVEVTGADIMSVDNDYNVLGDQAFYQGIVKYSQPAGTYEICSWIPTTYPDGTASYSLAAEPDVHVHGDTTVTLDARKATQFAARTPKPASVVFSNVSLERDPVVGLPFTTSLLDTSAPGHAPDKIYVTPARPVTVGKMGFYTTQQQASADGSYLYNLFAPHVGQIPRDLVQTVTAAQLTTVDSTYHSPYPGRVENVGRAPHMPGQASIDFTGVNISAPLQRTEYFTALPGLQWYSAVVADAADFLGYTQDIVRMDQAGQHLRADWLAQPMAPGLEQETAVGEACPVCRSGDNLDLNLMPFTDNNGHYQLWDPTTSDNLSLYQDGALVGQAAFPQASFPMSASPAGYKLVLDQAKDAPWWPASTRTSTTWTWNSQESAPSTLPPGWTCPAGKGGGGRSIPNAPDATCTFEPLVFIGYKTSAGADDVVPAGANAKVDLTVGHQIGADATAITDVTAQVSFDDGKNWTTVPATKAGDGHYQLSYAQPALNATTGFASLRVTATDASGSSVDQTITRAYPLSVQAAPASSATPQPSPGQREACGGAVAAPYAQCMAVVNAAAPKAAAGAPPTGFGPADLRSAYNLPDAGAGQTVAIVDAYDNPNAEADLATYRQTYGLPPCTTGNGCFTKVNQDGKASPLPSPDSGWGTEISLDLDMVSAACPKCRIMLVEANSSSTADLGPSVDTAVSLGADVVSNSYGSFGEYSGENTFDQYYNHPHVPIVVSTGDYGYGNGLQFINSIAYPAASKYVIAVGGTSLAKQPNSARGWTESAWDGATSGCSAYEGKPTWQKDHLCGMRSVADISAVADPKTGVAVYDTFGQNGWMVVGGTSAAAPIIASVYALAGNAARQHYAAGLYANPSLFNDVISGVNGDDCSGTYLCTAVPGYDGPTGLGTPNGTRGF